MQNGFDSRRTFPFPGLRGAASLASLLLFGALVAACGGDEASPTGTTSTTSAGSTGGDGGAGGAAAGGGGASAGDIVAALEAIPGLDVVDEGPSKFDGYKWLLLSFDQPVDHQNPSGPHFKQRLILQHRSTDAPLVLDSTGYGVFAAQQFLSEPAELLEGNDLLVEHRFFTPSRPEPADWAYLTIEQAAADHHAIVEALKPLYTARWISTGVSKGGMTTIYHRRFYPGDVDGAVAYSAPLSFGVSDARYVDFVAQVGDASCRDALKAFQLEALNRRPAMLAAMTAQAEKMSLTYDVLGMDGAFEYAVVELPFAFWQYYDASLCASIPGSASTDAEVWSFLDEVNGPRYWGDFITLWLEPYYFQAGTQLGYPGIDDSYLAQKLLNPGSDVPATFVVPAPGKEMVFDPESMKGISDWVTTQGEQLLFVYGQNDPWMAGAFEVGSAKESARFVAPSGNHGSEIADLVEQDRQASLALLEAWSGVKPKVPEALVHERARAARDQARRLFRR